MLHALQHALAVGLGANFNKGVGVGVASRGAQECRAGRRDQFTENSAAGARRKEIRPWSMADPRPGAAIIADGRVIKGQFHELREAHPAA
jgi:hypothetical protein